MKHSVVTLLACAGVLAVQPARSQSAPDLPADIDRESLSRLPALERSDLDEAGRAAWDLVVGDGPRPTSGPRAVTMYSPKVAEAFHNLNEYLRREGVLGPKLTEVAIIVAAWEIEQQYEYSAHEPAALRYGASQDVIDAVKYDRPTAGLPAEEKLIIDLGRQLLREHRLDSELFAAAVEAFGEQGVVELVTVMGDYVMAGMLLTAIDQRQPADRPALLPQR